MKDDKICFPKTLTYLVLLVVALIGGFYIMNYVNNNRLTSESEAAGACRNAQGVKGIVIKRSRGTCGILNIGKDTYKEFTDYKVEGFRCCMLQRQPNAYSGSETKETCRAKRDLIADKFNNGSCTYYTGEVSSQGRCKVGVNADSIACSPGVGSYIGNRNTILKDRCGDLKGKIKDDVKIAGNGNRTCLVYSGDYRQSGNRPDWIDNCLAENKIDINTADKGQNAAYKTGNCGNVK